jgi:hypothetical protein
MRPPPSTGQPLGHLRRSGERRAVAEAITPRRLYHPGSMDLSGEVREALSARGYEVDGTHFLTRRPDRLAVGLRTASGVPAVGKLYRAGGGEITFQNMQAVWHSSFGERREPPGLARPIDYLEEVEVLVMENLGGQPLVELDYLAETAFRNSVELLAALHGCDAVLTSLPRTASRIVKSLRRKQARIAELAPEYASSYAAAVDAAEAAQPGDGELVCCHGDFSPRNVLQAPDRYALIDWDRLKLSDPARDVAHFGAWCWLRALHERQVRDWSALDRFTAAYAALRPGSALDGRRLDFHLAAALLRMVAARVELWREESYLIPQLIEEAARRAR